jgi:hypothetical protein
MDLFRYNAPGQFQWAQGQPAYLSINGGQTDLANFDTTLDYGDFAIDTLTPSDPFDYHTSNPPVTTLSSLDIELMDVLGFNTTLRPRDDKVDEHVPVGSVTAVEGVSTAIGGVQVIDDGFNGETFQTTITAQGNLSASSASGATVSGSGTQDLTITGTLSQVNGALATLSYDNSTGHGTDSVTVTTADLTDQSSSSKSFTINVDDDVSLNLPASFTISPPGAIPLFGAQMVTDDGLSNETFTTTVTATTGTFSTSIDFGAVLSGSGTSSVTITGSNVFLVNLNFILSQLRYTPAGVGTDTISVTVTDSDGSTAHRSIPVTTTQGTPGLYDFVYVYADGSSYHGTVSDDGTYGYQIGQRISGVNGGVYAIIGSEGATSQLPGTVFDYSYYDSASGQHLTPFFSNRDGHAVGLGLGIEHDYVLSPDGVYRPFGSGGAFEALTPAPPTLPTTLYDFVYVYADGSSYHGTVADNGTYGYHVGQRINGANGGLYAIIGSEGATSRPAGTVFDYSYYDAASGQRMTPFYSNRDGHAIGLGLGIEHDYVLCVDGVYRPFGSGGAFEATVPIAAHVALAQSMASAFPESGNAVSFNAASAAAAWLPPADLAAAHS